jgi:hypothetical protein
MSFFPMPLAQTWLAITMFKAPESICSLQARKVICKVAPGQALVCFDNCPENRDESNPHRMFIDWLQFIPFFGTLQSHLLKGHRGKKTSPCSLDSSLLGKREYKKGYLPVQQKVSFTDNP